MKSTRLKRATSLLFFFAATNVCPATSEAESASESFSCVFTAKITEVTTSGESHGLARTYYAADEIRRASGGVLTVGHDARWRVLVTIIKSEGEHPLFQDGEEWELAVHSPVKALNFSATEATGKTMRLELLGSKKTDGRLTFLMLRAHSQK
jgi:hypothetical protein